MHNGNIKKNGIKRQAIEFKMRKQEQKEGSNGEKNDVWRKLSSTCSINSHSKAKSVNVGSIVRSSFCMPLLSQNTFYKQRTMKNEILNENNKRIYAHTVNSGSHISCSVYILPHYSHSVALIIISIIIII